MNFGDYVSAIGYKSNPYVTYNAEQEKEFLSSIIHRNATHESLLDSFKKGQSIVIAGERGTGKSALVHDIAINCTNALIVEIYNYEQLPINYNIQDLSKFILDTVSESLFLFLAKNNFKKIKKDDRLFLSALYKQHVDSFSEARLKERLTELQHHAFKLLAVTIYNKSRSFLNFIIHSGRTTVSQFAKDYLPWMSEPPADVMNYIAEITIHTDENVTFKQGLISALEKIARIANEAGASKMVIIFDKIDEDPRFGSDISKIANFISPLISNIPLVSNEKFQTVISTWRLPYLRIRDAGREQKGIKPHLTWGTNDIKTVWENRHTYFSNSASKSVDDIFDVEPGTLNSLINKIISLSNNNPRDLWHLLHYIIQEQYAIDSSRKITEIAIEQGINKFVTEFNYPEYYPRELETKNTKRDIYNYIVYLARLPAKKFTTSNLRDGAGAGGRTNDVISEMTNIGLIRPIDHPDQRVRAYEVLDPKIAYCIEKKLTPTRYGSAISLEADEDISTELGIAP